MEAKPSLIHEVIEALKVKPRVMSLKPEVEDVRVGLFFTGVKLSTGHAGVAHTPVGQISHCCPRGQDAMAGNLTDLGFFELIHFALNRGDLLKRAIGIAALNAFSSIALDEECEQCQCLSGVDALSLLDIQPEDKVVVVGAFPFIKRLKDLCKKVVVLEKDPGALDDHSRPCFGEERHIEDAQVLIITGASLVNDTLEPLLRKATLAREVALVGPTSSMFPLPFFKRGIRVMAGVRVKEPEMMLRIISQAGGGPDLFRSGAAEKVVLCSKAQSVRMT